MELMTPREIAALFKIRRVRTIYDWIEEGLFPNVISLKGSYRIPRTDVDRLIEQSKLQKVCPPVPPPIKRRVISRGVH